MRYRFVTKNIPHEDFIKMAKFDFQVLFTKETRNAEKYQRANREYLSLKSIAKFNVKLYREREKM